MLSLISLKSNRLSFEFKFGALVLLCFFTPPILAVDDFYDRKKEGWFFYQDPPPEEDVVKEEVPVQTTVPSTPSGPTPLSTEWIRENLPKIRDTAIDNPNRENTLAYAYAQRLVMDKAQNFSNAYVEAVKSDPLLDENLRLPFSTAARVAMLKGQKDEKDQAISSIANSAGLWVFHDDTCQYCLEQVSVINIFADRYGFDTTYISKSGSPIRGLSPNIRIRRSVGHFESLGVDFTPSIFLLVPPDKYYFVSRGIISKPELIDMILVGGSKAGLISDQQLADMNPLSKGVMSGQSPEIENTVNWDDPVQITNHLRQQIIEAFGPTTRDE